MIYAEAKLGELLKGVPKPKFDTSINGSLRGTTETLPAGIDKKTSHQAQTIAANPEKVRAAIDRAIQEEKIPTPDFVYKMIKTPHYLTGENWGYIWGYAGKMESQIEN